MSWSVELALEPLLSYQIDLFNPLYLSTTPGSKIYLGYLLA